MLYKILLIDKDKSHVKALKMYLERQHFEVFIANPNDEAPLLFNNFIPDILIADPGFLETGTIHLLKQIMESHPAIKVILYTHDDYLVQVMEELGPGVVNYLTKPVKSQALDFSLKQAKNWISVSEKLDKCQKRLTDLSDTRSLFQQLFDEVPCYISVQDRQFRLTATNRMFKKDFGDEIGSYCYKVYKHRSTPCQECPVASTFADGLPHPTEEIVTSKLKFPKQNNSNPLISK